ncbi:MAG: dehypoxanthine futalosine cyclase [Candidatus Omnitrophica bacterium]|nr:dehypoxanthine futalosine cyclase [Candidatus Omnitrophota bacterium]MDD5672194.1 dehypoxanthine futalosine cyclase [Candidatus Omnitrophota bacterium]
MDIHERILSKCLEGTRLSRDEGAALYACDLLSLGRVADEIRRRSCPAATATFVVDRNISYTNACTVGCEFCAFHRGPQTPEAFTLSLDEIVQKVKELVALGGTQVMIQGGINPGIELDYYLELVRVLHQQFPQVHIHSFSVMEFDMISKRFGVPLPKVLRLFKDAGLNSVPGGGAEILVDRVRELISPNKVSAARWLEVMRMVHEAGLRSTATMVIAHLETIEERIAHLTKLRGLQDETGGFRAFIPWTMTPTADFPLEARSSPGGEDYLKTVAIARLMLDNFEHVQSGWLTEGLKMGQLALRFGCDDMGGTLLEDKVLESAGVEIKTRREDLIRLIREAGFIPAQRDTNYEILHVYN